MFKKAIKFTCVEIVIFFIIFMIHDYVFGAPSIGTAYLKGFFGLFYRVIYGQIFIELILLTLLFYSAFKYKMLLAVLAVMLAEIISVALLVTELSHILEVFMLPSAGGFLNILSTLGLSSTLTALLFREHMDRVPKHSD